MTMLSGASVANGYLQFPFTTDPDQLVQAALAALASSIPGWVPYESAPEVLLLEQMAAMVAETAAVAAVVPLGIFEYFGTLIGVAPQNGAYATAETTWTAVDTQGYTIPAGTIVAYQTSGNTQVQFATMDTAVIPVGQTSVSGVQIEATAIGTSGNSLAPATLQLVQPALAFVQSIVSTTTSSGGENAETLFTYLNRLSNELRLLAPRPIIPSDFAALVTAAADSNGNSLGVYRAMAIDNLNPGRTIADATLNATTALVDPAGSFTVNDVGKTVTGTDIPTSTTISAFVSATEVTMSAAATGSLTGATVTLGDLSGVERCVTVACVDVNGNAFDAAVQGEIVAWLGAYREVNFLVFSISPTITEVDVTWTGVTAPTFSAATVEAAANAALGAFLSRSNWATEVVEFNGTVTQDSPTITSVVPLLPDLAEGQIISGYGIPSGTTVTSVNPDGSVTISNPATASGVAVLTVNLSGTWDTTANVVRYLQVASILQNTPGMAYVTSVVLGPHGGSLSAADCSLPGDAPLADVGTITGSVT